jgi:hypothetical protein
LGRADDHETGVEAGPPARGRHAAFEHFLADGARPGAHVAEGIERHRDRPLRVTGDAVAREQWLDVGVPGQVGRNARVGQERHAACQRDCAEECRTG